MNFDFQNYAFNKIREHKKVALVWFRQSGKSKMIVDLVIDYVSKNQNKSIIIYSWGKSSSKWLRKRFADKLEIEFKYTAEDININNCIVKFRSYQRLLNGESGDFMIIDDFNNMTKRSFDIIKSYISSAPKILLVCSGVGQYLLELDFDGKYYLNVVNLKSVMSNQDVELIKKNTGYDDWLLNLVYDVSYSVGNIYKFYKIKKNKKMIDYYTIKKQRIEKLKKLNSSLFF